jgi:hypothetical protein
MFPALSFVALLATAVPAESASRFLTGIAAQGAAANAGADVLTSTDLKTAFDLEAQKQLAACAEGSSCLAEIAQALDANIVISGTLLAVGEGLTLQLSAYDAKKAASAGRRVLRAPTVDAFADELEATTRGFLEPLLVGRAEPAKLRVLVLDIDTSPAAAALDPSLQTSASAVRWVQVAGGGVGTVGVLGALLGGTMLLVADQANAAMTTTPKPTMQEQRNLAAQRDQFFFPGLVALGGGTLLTLVGGTVFVLAGTDE